MFKDSNEVITEYLHSSLCTYLANELFIFHIHSKRKSFVWRCSFKKGASVSAKKETLAQVFSCKFCEIFRNTLFTEHLRCLHSNSLREISHFIKRGMTRTHQEPIRNHQEPTKITWFCWLLVSSDWSLVCSCGFWSFHVLTLTLKYIKKPDFFYSVNFCLWTANRNIRASRGVFRTLLKI